MTNQHSPCPFCGGRDIRAHWRGHPLGGEWVIECHNCSCELTGFASESAAWTGWNRRPSAPEPTTCSYVGAPQGTPKQCTLPAGHSGGHSHAVKSTAERREYHANGTYWSGMPTVDMPCDFCGCSIMEHHPKTHACPTASTGDYQVQCICGWTGIVSQLKGPTLSKPEPHCPKCGKEFASIRLAQARARCRDPHCPDANGPTHYHVDH